MARYNDTENTIKAIKKRFNVYHEIPCSQDDRRVQEIVGIVIRTIEEQPTADVVPKSEVERLQEAYNNKLAKDIETNADFVKYAKVEVAREIFEEIEEYVIKGISVGGEHLTLFNGKNFTELKKKYTEERK